MFDNWRPSPSEFAELLKTCRLDGRPGDKIRYSNVGYALLGDAVARTWNLSYEDAVRARITRPLGMKQTGFMWTNPSSQRAQGYNAEWEPVLDSANVPTLAPCCVLESSADDLLTLVRAYLVDTRTRTRSEIGPALARAALPVLQGAGSFDALGWFTTLPEGLLSKNGMMEGYRSSVVVDQKTRRGVVVLANQTAVNTDLIAFDLLRDVARLHGSNSRLTTLDALPASATPSDTAFEKGLRLVGYRVAPRVRRGENLAATFYFVKEQDVGADYKIFVHGDAEGARHRLHGDHYPPGSTDTWPVGKIVEDTVVIPVPNDTEPGARKLYFGFFAGDQRLGVTQGCSDKGRACGPSVKLE